MFGFDDPLCVGGRDLGDYVYLALGIAYPVQCFGGVEVVNVGDPFEARASFLVPVVGVRFENYAVAAGEVSEDPGRRQGLPVDYGDLVFEG